MLRLQKPLPDDYRNAPDDELGRRIGEAKAALGSKVFILGHHYQRDEVMVWADARGDSFKLAQLAKGRPEAAYIVFCGVHFMAESADILTSDDQAVILPDLNAGCSMADMADLDEVEEAWETLGRMIDIERVVPITYMNSLGRPEGLRRRARRRGLHLVQRPGRPRLGLRAGRQDPLLPRPAPRAATRATRWATARPTCGSGTRGSTPAA